MMHQASSNQRDHGVRNSLGYGRSFEADDDRCERDDKAQGMPHVKQIAPSRPAGHAKHWFERKYGHQNAHPAGRSDPR